MTIEEKLSQVGQRNICPVGVFLRNGKVLSGLRNYTAAHLNGDDGEDSKRRTISVWTCPGGRCEDGETIEQALRRETLEEVGVDNFKILKYLGEAPGAKQGDIVPIFICETDQESKLMEPHKFTGWQWFGPKALPENYINPAVRKIIADLL